jgi:hypothetical protein
MMNEYAPTNFLDLVFINFILEVEYQNSQTNTKVHQRLAGGLGGEASGTVE